MGRVIAIVLLAGCLDTPGVADPAGSGSDHGGSAADSGAEAAACADGSGVAIAFPTHLFQATGSLSYYENGIALIINTGSVPLALDDLSIRLVSTSDVRVTGEVAVTASGVVAPAGEAVGYLATALRSIVSEAVVEPWTENSRPYVAIMLDQEVGEDIAVTIDFVAALGERAADFSIDLVLDQQQPPTVAMGSSRVDLSCTAE